MSLTPPRAADAMLYHLAQLKLIAQDHGYRFYPYITYHFPMFFGLLSLPGFMLFSGVAYKVNVFITFCISIMITLRIASLYKIKSSHALFFILFFTPLCFHEAHSALNDWPVICFGLLGYYFLFVFSEVLEAKYLYLAFAALGFSLGIKYQAILYLPGAAFFTLYVLMKNKQYRMLKHVVGSGVVMLLVASPFYVKNRIYFHNPVWPLAVNIFHGKPSYLNELAVSFAKANSGQHNVASLFNNLRNFTSYPLIPASIWGCIFLSVILSFKQQFKLVMVLILYFLTWWLFQPDYYLRFSIFILPLGLLIGFRYYEENSLKKVNKYVMRSGYVITMLFSVPLFLYYSAFYAKLYVSSNAGQYHQYTMYYPVINWINRHTPRNAKVLTLLESGQTYYIDRKLLRADSLSGALNWKKITSVSKLRGWLVKNKINYIVSGGFVPEVMKQYLRSGAVNIIYNKKVRVYSSRLMKRYAIDHLVVAKL
jgi:4-amino-4-deoxy-L-arabinose transferase-like glycosyltransferase